MAFILGEGFNLKSLYTKINSVNITEKLKKNMHFNALYFRNKTFLSKGVLSRNYTIQLSLNLSEWTKKLIIFETYSKLFNFISLI